MKFDQMEQAILKSVQIAYDLKTVSVHTIKNPYNYGPGYPA